MGTVNARTEKTIMVAVHEMGDRAEPDEQCGHSGSVYSCNRGKASGPSELCEGSLGNNEKDRKGQSASQKPSSSSKGGWCSDSGEPSNTYQKGSTDAVGVGTKARPQSDSDHSMEDNVPMGGSGKVIVSAIHKPRSTASYNRLGANTKGKEEKPLHNVKIRCDQWRPSPRNQQTYKEALAVRNPLQHRHGEGRGLVEAGPSYEGLQRPQCEERCDPTHIQFQRGEPEEGHPNVSHQQTGEARDVKRTSLRNNAEVRRVRQEHRGISTNPAGNKSPMSATMVRRVMQNFTRKSKITRIPTTEEERSSPLHVHPVKPLEIQKVEKMMTKETLKRFKEVCNLTFNPRKGKISYRKGNKRSELQTEHANKLVEAGIATQAGGPGELESIPFTVLEERQGANRQRFILWTREANQQARSLGYDPKVPLGHISCYLDRTEKEVASQWDLRTGFYQVPIPQASRRFFRFQDSAHNWFELTRLPMGHVAAPEIMHTLTATVAGDPTYAKPEFTYKGVVTDIWIDNIRISGDLDKVEAATDGVNKIAADCNVTWKAAETIRAATDYDFLGVHFNHLDHTVSVAKKLRNKIQDSDLTNPTAGGVESLAGRLLHASAITRVHPGNFWYALKFFRRITNSLNRGVCDVNDCISIPISVRKQIEQWVGEVSQIREIKSFSDDGSIMMFVDASNTGWGAVIISKQAEMKILGQRWTTIEGEKHINILEAKALHLSLQTVEEASHIDIYVDNTTVAFSTKKGMSSRSYDLNREVIGSLNHLQRIGCAYTISWVSTKCNPADYPSRSTPTNLNQPKLLADAKLALGRFFNLRGGGGSRVVAKRHYSVTTPTH